MSSGGDSGQKGPAVSAQEAQMQAIMQQARVTVLTHCGHMSHIVLIYCIISFPFDMFVSMHENVLTHRTHEQTQVHRHHAPKRVNPLIRWLNISFFYPVHICHIAHFFLLVLSLPCVALQVQWVWLADLALWYVFQFTLQQTETQNQ